MSSSRRRRDNNDNGDNNVFGLDASELDPPTTSNSNSNNNQHDNMSSRDNFDDEPESEDLLHDPLAANETLSIPTENIRVQAPNDLPMGYELETVVEGRAVLVTVPIGGVTQGETFTPSKAVLLNDDNSSTNGSQRERSSVPVGAWKDSLWDLCALGCCHVTVWNSCCCSLIGAGQVITRLQLTWWGTPGTNISQVAIAFQVMCMLLVAYWSTRMFVFLIIAYLDPNTDPNLDRYVDPPVAYFVFAALDDVLSYVYLAFMVLILRNVRSHLRQRYAIPASASCCCPRCEDCCCSMVCPCLTVAQMMRHTADYDKYPGACCSPTGLIRTAPGIV